MSKISQMIFHKSTEGINFSEEETTIFRNLFGNQVLEAM